MLGRTAGWVGVTVLVATVALGQGRGQSGGGQQGGGATANGAAILSRSCGNCHNADVITNYHYDSADGYREIVNSMVSAGAQVTPQEVPVLVDYLFTTYGKKQEAGGAAATAQGGTDPGKAILESACTVCHGLDTLTSHVYDSRDPYEGLIRNMIGYGAAVTDAQVPVLADYMLKTYGKKPANAPAAPPASTAAAPDGKAILESACTVCHGLDGLANHKYESAKPYEELVRSMIAYGAAVTDAQMGPLVDYMFKTYGKK